MEIVRSYKVFTALPHLYAPEMYRPDRVMFMAPVSRIAQDSISRQDASHVPNCGGAAQQREIKLDDVYKYRAPDGHLRCWNFLLAFIEPKVRLLFCRFTTSVLYTSESGTNGPLTRRKPFAYA
jgi:hypothetical protein